jgi:hypothetical protein
VLEPGAPDRREPDAIARARCALALVRSDVFGWPSDRWSRRQISDCADLLKDDLETYEALLDGRIHPAVEFPELEQGWSGDVLEQAIEKVTRDIVAGASVLTGGMGEQDAEQVNDRFEGGAS